MLDPELVAELDRITVLEFDDGRMSALDHCSNIRLVVETDVPIKARDADGRIATRHERHWAIDWPFLADSIDWGVNEGVVERAFGDTTRDDVAIKRRETLDFLARADADAAATQERWLTLRRKG
jgi:hypothetical protein